MKPTRISLTRDDFRLLVSGEIVDIEAADTKIRLSDIGFGAMHEAINDAEGVTAITRELLAAIGFKEDITFRPFKPKHVEVWKCSNFYMEVCYRNEPVDETLSDKTTWPDVGKMSLPEFITEMLNAQERHFHDEINQLKAGGDW